MGLPTEGQRCPKCGASAESNSSFCTACGNALLRSRCENCAEPLSEGAGFCIACGTPVFVGKSTSNQIPDQQARIDSTPPLVNSHVVYEAAAQEEGSEEASCPLELGPDERRLGTYSVGSILDPKVGGQLYLTTKRLALVWSPPKSQAVRTCSIPLDQITQVEAEKGNLSIESRAALSSGFHSQENAIVITNESRNIRGVAATLGLEGLAGEAYIKELAQKLRRDAFFDPQGHSMGVSLGRPPQRRWRNSYVALHFSARLGKTGRVSLICLARRFALPRVKKSSGAIDPRLLADLWAS